MAIALAKGGLPLLQRLIILATKIRTPFRAEVKRRTSESEVHGRVGEIHLLIYLYGIRPIGNLLFCIIIPTTLVGHRSCPVQRKMGALWLKSQRLSHKDICRLTVLSLRILKMLSLTALIRLIPFTNRNLTLYLRYSFRGLKKLNLRRCEVYTTLTFTIQIHSICKYLH